MRKFYFLEVQDMDRPFLSRPPDSGTFRSFYYLKDEPADFCRENGPPAFGDKIDLTERIAHYLDTGKQRRSRPQRQKGTSCRRCQ